VLEQIRSISSTGAQAYRITGLPNVAFHLAYDADGERLAATLGGTNGLRLYRAGDDEEIARDPDYGDSAYWADFADDGRLVTSCLDGKLRLYGPDGDLERTAAAPGGERPYGVAFTPDGSRTAVGYDDSIRVDVLDAASLALVHSADTASADNGSLSNVA